MQMLSTDTDVTPNQGGTYGSQALQVGGKQTRAAAAAAYQALLGMASTRLGVPVGSLTVSKGVVSGGGKTVTYGDLIGGKLFNVTIRRRASTSPDWRARSGCSRNEARHRVHAGWRSPGPAADRHPGEGARHVHLHPQRPDPGHASCPGRSAAWAGRVRRRHGSEGALRRSCVDQPRPERQGIQKNNFVAVVAPKEYDAIQAAAQLKVTWAPMPQIPGVGNLWGQMRNQDKAGQASKVPYSSLGNVDSAIAGSAHTVSQTYMFHYNGHLPIGPSCSVADVTSGGARIFTNSQDCYSTRGQVVSALALAGLNLPANQVRVTYSEGSSVYGFSPYDDCTCSAAVISYLAGAPVRLQFMRWDEHGWDNYAPAQLMDVRGGVDTGGNITGTDFSHFSIQLKGTDAGVQALGATAGAARVQLHRCDEHGRAVQDPEPAGHAQGPAAAQPVLQDLVHAGAVRTCGGFAYEQLIDELAYAAKMDPVAFRLQNITSNANETKNNLRSPGTAGRTS